MAKAKNDEIEQISRNAIDCIEGVAQKAEEELRDHRRAGAATLTTVHTLNHYAPVNSLGAISDAERQALERLRAQPVIARVEYTNDDGKTETIFVTRSTPIVVPGFKIASYNSPVGKIAAVAAGGTYGPDDVVVESSTKLFPKKDKDGWDSPDTEIDLGGVGKFTVASLRALLEPQIAALEDDPFAALDGGEREKLVAAGIRRAVLSHIALRDRPILDQHQDEIFRLQINVRCFLSGPPGTGKTTTLIRRLGQKTAVDDPGALDSRELSLIRQAEEESGGMPHRTSWIMFSPTELLRQYVKEAFAREGFPATDHHTRTWNDYRREIARDYLGLLRTGTGGGLFIERQNDDHLDLRSTTNDPAGWYDDFDAYVGASLHAEINGDIDAITGSEDAALTNLGRKLTRMLSETGPRLHSTFSPQVAALREEIRTLLDQRRIEIGKIINRTVNRVVFNDPDFLSALKQEIERESEQSEELQEDTDDDAELEDGEVEAPAIRFVSREEARSRYERAVIALARARLQRRSVPAKSRNGQLLEWLGAERVPERAELQALARISDDQRRLRRFANLDRLLIRGIPRLYKKFRAERAEQSIWYSAAPTRSVDISWRELDLVILATLRMADQLLAGYRRASAAATPEGGILGDIRSLYRNQVLVDEATDFSVLQLACMYQLTHPVIKSFFMCGDLNQRLTSWGVRSNEQLDWVVPQIERRSITVAYRQSAKLVALAKDVALLGGSSVQDIELPDRVDNEGVPPVWASDLGSDDRVADWLALRIREIERIVGKVPTIAVLVNEEGLVEPLATVLNTRLQEISLSAVACKDGKVVGNDRDVRVFNIEHIKGLEFEAVFFVGLDQTIDKLPDLYTKYLYVGATRAANYLGVTFTAEVRQEVRALAGHFQVAWSA
ncbi:ATP-binding domain-containing protein [Aminobacter sp. Piv2-1]|uniref:ATP-binding domain-containing protein n=1 Tax=Aminobacter sp. Piv2-1 TaxID=3031122 RepID=UPI00309D5CC8